MVGVEGQGLYGSRDFDRLAVLDVPVGSVLLFEGQWKVDSRYGQQFVVESWEEVKSQRNLICIGITTPS